MTDLVQSNAIAAPSATPGLSALLARRRAKMLWTVGSVPVAMLLLTAVLAVTANAYWLTNLTAVLAVALACAGVAMLYGQLGLVSLCQFALLGVGGWAALRLGHGLGLPFTVNLLVAGAAASAVGVLWGLPALRLRGLYLALVTLMLAGAYQVVAFACGFPDGGPGFLGRADSAQRLMLARPGFAESNRAYFIYCAAVVAVGLTVVEAHRHAKAGRAWALIRKGPAIAEAAGVNLLVYKLWAFALSGFMAGVGGALLAGSAGQLDGRAFSASESVMLYALTVVGGVYNWFGALLAGVLLRAVPALFTDLGVDGNIATLVFGAALLHALITEPTGLAGRIATLIEALKGRGKR